MNAEHYNLISDLLKEEPISRQLKGFLILLKCKCLNGTNTTKFSQNQLAKELGISTGAISQYMKDAIDNAYVSKNEKGIHLLREDIFLKAKTEFRKVKPAKPKEKLVILMD